MLNIHLIAITNEDFSKIPLSIADAFSNFKYEDAQKTYIAVIVFEKNISFYKTVTLFQKLSLAELQTNMLRLTAANTNRVHPAIGKPIEPGLHVIIAQLLKEKAQALGGTYQIYKVICIFKNIYDKSQTCCCGLIGYDDYKLYKLSKNISDLLNTSISDHSGCIQNNHFVCVAFNSKDISDCENLLKTTF